MRNLVIEEIRKLEAEGRFAGWGQISFNREEMGMGPCAKEQENGDAVLTIPLERLTDEELLLAFTILLCDKFK